LYGRAAAEATTKLPPLVSMVSALAASCVPVMVTALAVATSSVVAVPKFFS
jgi:hypothetical protein